MTMSIGIDDPFTVTAPTAADLLQSAITDGLATDCGLVTIQHEITFYDDDSNLQTWVYGENISFD